ncbi:DUF805 domain-containing protein [uncultured Moraxella sp.]|uniref:DUF805 domain-containing protein n=1 Tax=uncultured Moraxella sp. TaxID=263769 RepID=UPI0025FA86AB|nr:DUF805 domain-containing protein [uncultured Moraxella sp.]
MNNDYTPPPLYDDYPFYHYKGRIGRIRYLAYSMILNILLSLLFAVPMGVLFAMIDAVNPDAMFGILLMFWLPMMLIGLYTTFAPTIRRLHDLGKTGWMSLLLLVPLVNLILLLYLLFAKGEPLPNQYGNPAKPAGMVLKVFVVVMLVLQLIWAIAFFVFFDALTQSAQMGQFV